MKKIFLLMGKAGAGKDTLAKYLSDRLNIPIALSFTTRPMRVGEKQGREYNFIDIKDFEILHETKKLAEYTSYDVAGGDTWFYGYSKKELEKAPYVIVIVNPDGQRQIQNLYGDKVHSILVDSCPKERVLRYLNREQMNEQKISECCRRFLADVKDFADIEVDTTITNNDLNKSKKEIEEFVRIKIAKDLLEQANNLFKDNPYKFLGENNE